MSNHSKMFYKVKDFYETKDSYGKRMWSKARVEKVCTKGIITEDEKNEILGDSESEEIIDN